jgi:capsular exopolysaccharide synthesis family protein
MIGRREMGTALGGFGSLFLILLGFAWLEFRARRVDSREELMQTVGLNYIGSVPDTNNRSWINLGAGLEADLVRNRLLMDSVDGMRTQLMSAARDEPLQVVMVTSARSGEGKTSTACHLAASLARTGQKTLLIDCDLRKSSIHKVFGVAQGPGLSEVLRRECEVADAIQPTDAEELSVLAAGDTPSRTIQYLSDRRIAEVLTELRKQFDFIVVDSSPVMLIPEAQVFSQHVDGVIISVMHNRSKLPQVNAASDLLDRLRARLLGFVLNGVRGEMHTSPAYYLPTEAAAAN